METLSVTIGSAIENYLKSVEQARSAHTTSTYRNAMTSFRATLADHGSPTKTSLISELTEDAIAWFIADLKGYAPATERLYLTAAAGFLEYVAAEKMTELNLPRMRLLIRQRARRPGQRLPQFPREDIEKILEYAINISNSPVEGQTGLLRNLRDRAFLLTLADTGLRVHEACALRRGDVDWNESRAIIIGKGDKQAVIRFSTRSMAAIKDYLAARSTLDGAAGKPLASLPLFARHDLGAGKKIKRITTRTGQNIVDQRVAEALGSGSVGSITPHSFRHYFVTMVLRGSGGNLKLAQELARHTSIAVTQRYAHLSDDELDQGYEEIFN
ncbi:MAG TPA: tyrosine-type recombinase/integrase [Anaerolineales bacterium]